MDRLYALHHATRTNTDLAVKTACAKLYEGLTMQMTSIARCRKAHFVLYASYAV